MFCAYLEQNTVNGKYYAGKGPWKVRHALRISISNNPKNDDYNTKIHRAYRKYGNHSFILHTICFFDTEDAAFDQEKLWINELNLMDDRTGYNMTLGGEGCSGRPSNKKGKRIPSPQLRTPEVREKARLSVIKSGGHKKTRCKRGHIRIGNTTRSGLCKSCVPIHKEKQKNKWISLGMTRREYFNMRRKLREQ